MEFLYFFGKCTCGWINHMNGEFNHIISFYVHPSKKVGACEPKEV